MEYFSNDDDSQDSLEFTEPSSTHIPQIISTFSPPTTTSPISSFNRYFQEQSEITCKYCRKQGHIFRNCKEKDTKCNLCDNAHDPKFCPLSLVCFGCYNRGHPKSECPDRYQKKKCLKCNLLNHSTMDCSKVWRRYKIVSSRHQSKSTNVVKYCYTCGDYGHFGDDCVDTDYSKNTTAFNSNVLKRFGVDDESDSFSPRNKRDSRDYKYDQDFKHTNSRDSKQNSSKITKYNSPKDTSRTPINSKHSNQSSYSKDKKKSKSEIKSDSKYSGGYNNYIQSTAPQRRK